MEEGEKAFVEKNSESRSSKKKKFRERDRSGGKETGSEENGGQEIYSKSVLF